MFNIFSKGPLSVLLAFFALGTINPSLMECSDSSSSNRFYVGAFGGGIFSHSTCLSQTGTIFFSEADGGPLPVCARGRSKNNLSGFGGVLIGYEWSFCPPSKSQSNSPESNKCRDLDYGCSGSSNGCLSWSNGCSGWNNGYSGLSKGCSGWNSWNNGCTGLSNGCLGCNNGSSGSNNGSSSCNNGGSDWRKEFICFTLDPAIEVEAFFYSHNKKGRLTHHTHKWHKHHFEDSFDTRRSVLLVNVVFSLNNSCGGISPYIGGGIGTTFISLHNAKSLQVSPEDSGRNHCNTNPSDSSWVMAAQVKAGLRYKFCDFFHIFGEYRYLYVDSSNFILGPKGSSIHSPTSPWIVKVKNTHNNAFAVGILFDL